jgi:hypothetical protein
VPEAAIVANAPAVEHYEMCRYGTLIAWAEELGHDDIVRFLTTNLTRKRPRTPNSTRWRCARASTRRPRPRHSSDQPEWLRETAEPPAFSAVRAFRTDRILPRMYQAATETTNQVSDAPIKATRILISTIREKTIAKASKPRAPSAAASSAAASRPRPSPAKPLSVYGEFHASRSVLRWRRRWQEELGRDHRWTRHSDC